MKFISDISAVIALLTLNHCVLTVLFVENVCPFADTLQDWYNGHPFFRQGIFYPGWNFIVGFSQYESVGDKVF